MTQLDFMLSPAVKPKEKVLRLADFMKTKPHEIKNVIDWAQSSRLPMQSLVMEAFEIYTRSHNKDESRIIWQFACAGVQSNQPSLIRESARVLANIANSHIDFAGDAIPRLLELTEHPGTVVRWSAAQALTSICSADQKFNFNLNPVLESIASREEKMSIRKIYLKALVKSAKRKSIVN